MKYFFKTNGVQVDLRHLKQIKIKQKQCKRLEGHKTLSRYKQQKKQPKSVKQNNPKGYKETTNPNLEQSTLHYQHNPTHPHTDVKSNYKKIVLYDMTSIGSKFSTCLFVFYYDNNYLSQYLQKYSTNIPIIILIPILEKY